MAVFLCFLFLSASLLSLWFRRDPKIWGGLLALSLISALIGGMLLVIGLIIALAWALLWVVYIKQRNALSHFFVFLLLVFLSFGFKFHLFPGFPTYSFSPKFSIGLDAPLVGLFPIALLVPLARTGKDWGIALKGLLFGCLGIAILAGIAVGTGTTHWQFKLPAFAAARYWSNLVLTSITEEGFYRGFLQNQLCSYLHRFRVGKYLALILTSLIFTAAHAYWSPNLAIQAFVFLASLLYGGVYLISGKIESAILCHFVLNFIHMTFFSYHAM